jgi:hypothetical protein
VIRKLLTRVAAYAKEPAIICLLGLPATVPLWKSTLPRSFDGLFHLFRLLEIDQLARQGVLLPRWAPDLFYGYGYPLFNFAPHLPYYVSELLFVMRLSLVHTMLLSFILALLSSGVAMYVFARDIFGSKAALISAVAYMYAPYHLYDILFRGHLPGAWVMVLCPLTLWAFRRLIRRGGVLYLALSSLLYAGCFLSHNPATFIFTPFLLFYLAFLVWGSGTLRSRAVLYAGAAVLLGVGLTAFFWLPALWDRQFVQLDRMITPPDLDYHNHFITLGDLLALPSTANTGLMNPGVPNSLGLVLVSLSVLSVVGLWRLPRPEERGHLIVALCGLANVLFMVTPQSVVVWDKLPLMKYLMFPHRLLSLACLLTAILCGAATRLFADTKDTLSPSFAVVVASAGMIIVSALPLLYPPYYAQLPLNPSFADMMAFERSTGTMGTTSFGEYLPVWVEWMPTTSPLEPMYVSGSAIQRLDEASLPAGVRVSSPRYTPTLATAEVYTPQAFQLVFNILYFPGWHGYVDGQRAAVGATPGLGLASLAVPSGSHVVQLRFEDTPSRTASELISALSGVALLAMVGTAVVRRAPEMENRSLSPSGSTPQATHGAPRAATGAQSVILAMVAIVVLGVKMGGVDRLDTPFKRDFDGVHVQEAQAPLHVNFGDQITLLGYDLTSANPRPGHTATVTLYWAATQPLGTDYSAFVHLIDEQMNIYAQQDSLNPGRYPTHLWQSGEYNKDSHDVEIPPGTPPGKYLLGVGLYDPSTMMRLPVLEEAGQRIGMYFLQEVTVAEPSKPPTIEELAIEQQVTVHFDNGMTLLGSSAERDTLAPGDFYRLALFWRAEKELRDSYSVAIRLINGNGEEALSQTNEPSAGRYPTPGWEEGEIVRDNHALWIPRNFPAGDYTVQLALLDSMENMVSAPPAADTAVENGWLDLESVGTGD